MSVTPQEIEKFKELYVPIENRAQQIRSRYIEILKDVFGDNIGDFDGRSAIHANMFSYEGNDSCVFRGTEFWPYGGVEDHIWEIPLSYLTDPSWEDKARAEMKQYLVSLASEQKQREQQVVDLEKETLKRLMKKYPDEETI